MEYMRTLIRFYVPTYKAAQPLAQPLVDWLIICGH